MIYRNEHFNKQSEWDAFYSCFLEKCEDCYIRWINCDQELTEAEIKLAIEWQEIVEADEPDFIEIEIPPEFEVSSEEFEAFAKIAHKLQKSGLGSIINAMLGNTTTMQGMGCMKGNESY